MDFPMWAIVLDVIGTLIVALGVYAQVGGEVIRTPDPADAHALSIVMIVAGVAMMAPLIVSVIKKGMSTH